MYIDTHTHLYDEQFDQDRTAMVRRAMEAGVDKMLLPNCDQHTIPQMLQLNREFPAHCLPMIGLHPVYVREHYEDELKVIHRHLENGNFVAVGEIGLDFYWDKTYIKEQQDAFETQIDWSLEARLPIVIHTRDSIGKGIETVRKRQNGHLKGVFHCFSGTEEQAREIIDLGFYLGIGGVLTFKNSALKDFVARLPVASLLLETDAPYLAPVPYRGKRNESSYIPLIAEYLGELYQEPVSWIADKTTQNARSLFGL